MKQQVDESTRYAFEQLLQFKKVEVLKNEPDGLRIRHQDGVCKVTYEELPEEVSKKYGMTAEGARDYREKVREFSRRQTQFLRIQEELKTSKLRIGGEIFQVVPGGILLQYASAETTKKIASEVPYKVEIDGPTGLHPDRPRRYRDAKRTEWKAESIYLGDLVYVRCESHSLSAGRLFTVDAYPDGNYSYLNVLNSTRTVAAYETDITSLVEERVLREIRLLDSILPADESLTIVKAHYGTTNDWVDVTDRAKELISNNRLEVHSACPASKTPTWISLTDPVPYKKKHTTITYRIGSGEEKTLWVPEGEKIILPP